MKKITLDGFPTSPADYAQEQGSSLESPETPVSQLVEMFDWVVISLVVNA